MTIEDDLREARRRYLQEAWDRHLIESWRKWKNSSVFKSIAVFCARNKIHLEELRALGILRIPPQEANGFELDIFITTFVAQYLPKLSDILFKYGEEKDAQIVDALGRGTMDCLKKPVGRSYVSHQDKLEGRRARRAMVAENMSHRLVREQRENRSRSNWKMHKP